MASLIFLSSASLSARWNVSVTVAIFPRCLRIISVASHVHFKSYNIRYGLHDTVTAHVISPTHPLLQNLGLYKHGREHKLQDGRHEMMHVQINKMKGINGLQMVAMDKRY